MARRRSGANVGARARPTSRCRYWMRRTDVSEPSLLASQQWHPRRKAGKPDLQHALKQVVGEGLQVGGCEHAVAVVVVGGIEAGCVAAQVRGAEGEIVVGVDEPV